MTLGTLGVGSAWLAGPVGLCAAMRLPVGSARGGAFAGLTRFAVARRALRSRCVRVVAAIAAAIAAAVIAAVVLRPWCPGASVMARCAVGVGRALGAWPAIGPGLAPVGCGELRAGGCAGFSNGLRRLLALRGTGLLLTLVAQLAAAVKLFTRQLAVLGAQFTGGLAVKV